jgi:hypothetical protein
MNSMGIVETLEFAGKEYLAGFIASKLHRKIPSLRASPAELLKFGPLSWVKSLQKENLTVPSLVWLNSVLILEEEFQALHRRGDKNQVYLKSGVYKGFCLSLILKYPQIPVEALEKYIKTRLCIKIKAVNKKVVEERREKAQKRADSFAIYRAGQQRSSVGQVEHRFDEEEEEEENSEDEDDFFEDEEMPYQAIPQETYEHQYQRYLMDGYVSDDD